MLLGVLFFFFSASLYAGPMNPKDLSRSIVKIRTYLEQRIFHPFAQDPVLKYFFGLPDNLPPVREEFHSGSGTIITKDGHVLTCAHVLASERDRQPQRVEVVLYNGQICEAKPLWIDSKIDLALLKITKSKNEEFSFVEVGDYNDVDLLDRVFVCGYPFGFEGPVSWAEGDISTKFRDIAGGVHGETTAPMNPGNSGGPVISQGKVIGVARLIPSPKSGAWHGIGFFVPLRSLDELLTWKERSKGNWGMDIQVTQNQRNYYPEFRVVKIEEGSPAYQAGIRSSDLIRTINDQFLTVSLLEYFRDRSKNKEKLYFEIESPGKKARVVDITMSKEISNKLSKTESFEGERLKGNHFLKGYNVFRVGEGVKVVKAPDTEEHSIVDEGDVILEINGEKIDSVETLKKILARDEKKSRISLRISKSDGSMMTYESSSESLARENNQEDLVA